MFTGGFGTMNELWEVLTLIQIKKVTKPLLVVLYGSDYWNEIINFPALVKYRMLSASDLNLIKFADTPEAASEYLKKELIKNLNLICKKDK